MDEQMLEEEQFESNLSTEMKAEILVQDIGMEKILEDNDLTEEDVILFLIDHGLIDLTLYFNWEY